MIRLLLLTLWSSLYTPVSPDQWSEESIFAEAQGQVLCEGEFPEDLPFMLAFKRVQPPAIRKSKHIGFLESDFYKCFEVVYYPFYPPVEYRTPYDLDTLIIFPFHEFS